MMKRKSWSSQEIISLSGGYWQIATLHAAVKLDIFTLLLDKKLSSQSLAAKIKGDARGITLLLNALVAMGLISKKGKDFFNTPQSRIFLCRNSDKFLGHMIMHHYHMVSSWQKLDKAVKSGRPVRSRMVFSDKQFREDFLWGMFNMAMNIAPRMAKKIKLVGRQQLLDLGGGPGTYAIHFCLKNPGLKATVFDLPTTRPIAEKIIKQFKLNKRINFKAGDFLRDSIKAKFDVAWLSHILHGENPQNCRRIIKKTVAALKPKGMIIIHEFILNNNLAGPLFPALFSLNMLLGTPGGQAYSEKQLKDMLRQEGVKRIRRIPISTPNDSGIILGFVDNQ